MISVFDSKDLCCGCGACFQACPKNAITMEKAEFGALYPKIDLNQCIDCGLCRKVCNHKAPSKSPFMVKAAAWDDDRITQCASGGMFAAAANAVIEQGGVVFGSKLVKGDNGMYAEMTVARTQEELKPLLGSKYVQTVTKDTFREAKILLQAGRMVLFSGTPCQIAGLRGFLRRSYDNLYTMDLLCHGVTGGDVFADYIRQKEKREKIKILDFKFREKNNGWGLYYYYYYYLRRPNVPCHYRHLYTNSAYYRMFLASSIYRDSCYCCPFARKERVGDISIGDCWGIEKEYPEYESFFDIKKGVSALLVNTSQGEKLYEMMLPLLKVKEVEYVKVAKYNQQLNRPSHRHRFRDTYKEAFAKGGWNGLRRAFYKKEWPWLLKEKIGDMFPLIIKNKIKTLYGKR